MVAMSKKLARDNFTLTTKRILAQRVGYKCSFPNCHRATSGPNLSVPNKSIIVGRACHIEAAAPGGPRYNPEMSQVERKDTNNGIWCCNFHADIIDNDTELYSVSALREWKQLAEAFAYEAIDCSGLVTNKPYSLVQVGHSIIFKGTWSKIDSSSKSWTFTIDEYLYSNQKGLDNYISSFSSQNTENYFVVDSIGYGRVLKAIPQLKLLNGMHHITFSFEPRVEFSSPDQWIDARFSFDDDNGPDLDVCTGDGWVRGKEAVIQSILILLGTDQGQWPLDLSFGTFLYKYYKDFHKNHNLLQRLLKLEIARKSSIPEDGGCISGDTNIPLSSIKWVDDVKIIGHSENYLEIDLRLYFTDDQYYSNNLRVPASLK